MTPEQRAQVEGGLAAASEAAARLFERHPPERLARRPAEGSWSAVECLAHLNLTTVATLPLIEAALADLRARGARRSSPSRMDWVGRMIRWSQQPTTRVKVQTSPAFRPPLTTAPPSDVLAEFLRLQARTADLLRAGEGLDLQEKMRSPFRSWLRYNVYASFLILEAHERRHLQQAERAAAEAKAAR